MKFVSVHLREGLYERRIAFSEHVNLIHSERNSKGKTTLLRFLLYGLGYPVSGTKNIRFDRCEVELVVTDGAKNYTVVRYPDYLEVDDGTLNLTYNLPGELNAFHATLFKSENTDVLESLLGVYYLDQEKGWTLLNRGRVTGADIRFNIQRLILGLSERSCDELRAELRVVDQELKKYQKMQSVAKYQEEIAELKETLSFDERQDELDREAAILSTDRRELREELRRINEVVQKNRGFKKYIAGMKLQVRCPSTGEAIPVNEDTIIDFRENEDYLQAKRRMLNASLAGLERRMREIEIVQENEAGRMQIETMLQSFDREISQVRISHTVVEKAVKRLQARKKTLNQEIDTATRLDNDVLSELYEEIMAYAQELDLVQFMDQKKDFVLTSDLKSLSGAVLHKMVYAFNLAYIRVVQRRLGITLPIILDSPRGREVDQGNIDVMMELLRRDFSENQIIIASIFEYPMLGEAHTIKIKDRLIDQATDYTNA